MGEALRSLSNDLTGKCESRRVIAQLSGALGRITVALRRSLHPLKCRALGGLLASACKEGQGKVEVSTAPPARFEET